MLEIRGLSVRYGQIQALDRLDMRVEEGEIISVIGANGAGKSTLLKAIAGLKLAMSGEIRFEGKPLVSKSYEMVRRGVALVPEGRRVFGNLSVYENLVIGSYLQKDKRVFQEELDAVYQLFPRLKERWGQAAATLSGGEQQMLAIGRALMSGPKLLMLDEPSLGLSPLLTEKLFELILEIRNQGTTILLVEQNAVSALSIANRGYVLKVGHITQSGTGQELLESQDILASYLGA